MNYHGRQITENLRAVRLAKGMSQAELSRLSGVPQAQISRIEANAVDLRLSSLMAIAHALDMEVTLVPRQVLPAIRSIARQAANERRAANDHQARWGSAPRPAYALDEEGDA